MPSPTSEHPEVFIKLREVVRTYTSESSTISALSGVDLEIETGSFSAITGPSGCGKSTLLNILGALDSPTSGSVRVGEIELADTDDKTRTRYRREGVGFVFQFFNLLPTMTVAENIGLPLRLAGVRKNECRARIDELLPLVGLEQRASNLPHQLSGGEMQRTAVARALAHTPPLLLADEPTGNLDSDNAGRIVELLQDIHRKGLATVVVVTHSEEVAAVAQRRIAMLDGEIVLNS